MSLTSLPEDLILDIISILTAHDLTKLVRVCKTLNRLGTPRLWTHIELHHPSVHEQLELRHPPPLVSPSRRFYHAPTRFLGRGKGETLFAMLHSLHTSDVHRLQKLAARVKSLCTVMEPNWKAWHLLPYFTSLESLELHGSAPWSQDGDERFFDVSAPPLVTLRYAKLFGYLPNTVAAWVLRSGTNLERLELGMLAPGIPTLETLDRSAVRLPGDEYYPEDWPGYSRLRGWAAIPRPLAGFLPSQSIGDSGDSGDSSEDKTRSVLMLPKLQHLSLCQPSRGDVTRRMVDYFWSSGDERAAHSDWEQILLASSQTLETLALEQRIGIEHGDGAIGESDYFIGDDAEGLGSELLMNILEKLLGEKKTFPVLAHVHLNGILVISDTQGRPVEDTPGGRLMRLLETIDVKCEARLGHGCWFDGDSGQTFWATWEGDSTSSEADDDEESISDLLASI